MPEQAGGRAAPASKGVRPEMPPARRRPSPSPRPPRKTRAKTRARRSAAAARRRVCPSSSSAISTSSASRSSPPASSSLRRLPATGTAGGPATPPSTACGWLIGAVHYVVPAALLAAGAMLVLRPVLPAVRPFRTGALCLFARADARARGRHARARPGRRAGRLGRRVRQAARRHGGGGRSTASRRTLLGTLGAHIVALFLFARRRAAAHRRLDRRRRQGDQRLVQHAPRAQVRRAVAEAPRRAAEPS